MMQFVYCYQFTCVVKQYVQRNPQQLNDVTILFAIISRTKSMLEKAPILPINLANLGYNKIFKYV